MKTTATPKMISKPSVHFLGKACRLAGSIVTILLLSGFEQPAVRVDAGAVGPRSLQAQTKSAVVRDYLQAWKSLSQALQQNRPDLLDSAYLGVAKEKLAETVQEQQDLGLQTHYRDLSHDIEIGFYSPEGLSVQLLDTVEYEMQIVDHNQTLATQHVRARYVAVLTPTEVRWKVRVFQAQPE
jgi:hypothetical protein